MLAGMNRSRKLSRTKNTASTRRKPGGGIGKHIKRIRSSIGNKTKKLARWGFRPAKVRSPTQTQVLRKGNNAFIQSNNRKGDWTFKSMRNVAGTMGSLASGKMKPSELLNKGADNYTRQHVVASKRGDPSTVSLSGSMWSAAGRQTNGEVRRSQMNEIKTFGKGVMNTVKNPGNAVSKASSGIVGKAAKQSIGLFEGIIKSITDFL